MRHNPKDILNAFQCDHIRMMEETFAQTLSEREDVRLFFINENRAFTDGKNIVVDPAIFELYADENALIQAGKFLEWPQTVLGTPWNALSIITRALNIHECLHILYTDFPCHALQDPMCNTKNKRKVMAKISNIIEDAYIEAVGCSCFDNMEFYLRFIRAAQMFLGQKKQKKAIKLKDLLAQGNEVIIPEKKPRTDVDRLKEYLSAMIDFLLYPWVWREDYNQDIAEYVNATKQFFVDGSITASPLERYEFCQKIFFVIEKLIPDDETELSFEELSKVLFGGKTHEDEGGIAGNACNCGKTQPVTQRLFTDIDGRKRKNSIPESQIRIVSDELAANAQAVGSIENTSGAILIIDSNNTGATPVHKNIKIVENHPKINYNLRKAYRNIYSKYGINIRSYASKFQQLLQAHTTTREDGLIYGNGMNSGRFGDPHKRYWYRQQEGTDVPDLAIMLLIDGSGSMRGDRIKSAMESSVILHEVLKQQGIPHAVVEHRACFEEPKIEANILVDFNSKEDEKLNILRLHAEGDNRDGLALYWAEKYIEKNTQNEHKIIIVLSDGLPAHEVDQYYPPVSTKDTANAVTKIRKRGTSIVAISLDDEESFDCYTMLSEIYPNLIACNDLSRLTGQLLGVVTKVLN